MPKLALGDEERDSLAGHFENSARAKSPSQGGSLIVSAIGGLAEHVLFAVEHQKDEL